MPEGLVLEFTDVTKRFGGVSAVDGLTARVEPGTVTGFLGPNGAGKTTTLRILLGLVRATSGTATIGGRRYADLPRPLQTVGAALEASSFHPGRTGANHLKVYARAAGLPDRRVDEVLGLVGLTDAAGRKVGGYSLGMRQRLGLAYTLLGDPGVLVLDEPANGLDPEGIKWLRGFLRRLADEGRTVLISSHMLAEVQQTVSALLIISRGRLVYQGDLAGLTQPEDYTTVIDSPDRAALGAALDAAGIGYEPLRTGFTVQSSDPAALGAIAAGAGVALSNLQRKGPALEEVFLGLVDGTRVQAADAAPVVAEPAPVVAESGAAAPVGMADSAPAAESAGVAESTAADPAASLDSDAAEEPHAEPPIEPEPEPEPEQALDPDVDPEPEHADVDQEEPPVPVDAPAHWDEGQARTDADDEADAFFARYDATVDPEPTGEIAPVEGPTEASSVEASTEASPVEASADEPSDSEEER
ncbi:ATP-binding cassette domain-containing protein [Microbacterium sp. bgisy203]|uniref:ABC transporter ATP-binding protein n=1 Tax=Microbacterium sp. bgisy203 TaxID=3413799 RepID=UPI003D70BDF6